MAEQKHRGPMGGGPRGMMPGEKAKDFKGTMGKLISYLGKYLPAIIAVMLFAIASTVFSIIGPKILGNATTELFNGIIAQLTHPALPWHYISGLSRAVLYPGLYHDKSLYPDQLRNAQGYQPEDQPHASGLF